jgi:hypothetical protein
MTSYDHRDEKSCDSGAETDDENEDLKEITGSKQSELRITEREFRLQHHLFHLFRQLGESAVDLLRRIVCEKDDNDPRDKVLSSIAESIPCQVGYIPSLRGIERFFARMSSQDDEVVFWRIHRKRTSEKKESETASVPQKDDNKDTGATSFSKEACGAFIRDPFIHPNYHVSPMHVFDAQRRIISMWQKRYLDPFGRRIQTNLWDFRSTICQAMCIGWMIQDGLLARLQYLETFFPFFSTDSVATSDSKAFAGSLHNQENDAKKQKKEKKTTTASRLKSKRHDGCIFEYPFFLTLPPGEEDIAQVPLLIPTESATHSYYKQILKERLTKQESLVTREEQAHPEHLYRMVSWDPCLYQHPHPTNPNLNLAIVIPPIFQPEIVNIAANTNFNEQLKQIFNVKQTNTNLPKIRYDHNGNPLNELNLCEPVNVLIVLPSMNFHKVAKKDDRNAMTNQGMSKKMAKLRKLQDVERYYWDRPEDFNKDTELPSFFDRARDEIRSKDTKDELDKSNFSMKREEREEREEGRSDSRQLYQLYDYDKCVTESLEPSPSDENLFTE